MSEFEWSDHPAVVQFDSPVSDLIEAVRQHDSILIRDTTSQYHAYRSSDIRIKPWYVKLNRLRKGLVRDYLDLSTESATIPIAKGHDLPADVLRAVELDDSGHPARVAYRRVSVKDLLPPIPDVWRGVFASPDVLRAPSPVDTTSTTRYPVIQPSPKLAPGIAVDFTIDLPSIPPDGIVDPDILTISGLAADWQTAQVAVELLSAHIEFAAPSGPIVLHCDGTSVACLVHGKIRAACKPGDAISVIATFLIDDRVCGFIRRNYTLGQEPGPPASHRSEPFEFDFAADPPVLTVSIYQSDPDRPGRLYWQAVTPRDIDIPRMPPKLNDSIDLGSDPAGFVIALYKTLSQIEPGKHLAIFRGFGEELWRKAPPFFQNAYWAMRKTLGEKFAIQFISTDPDIPWELMRPISDPDDDTVTDLLCMTHPVARCVGDSYGSLRHRLPGGRIATIAPKYLSANDRLERAQNETLMLQKQYAALPIAGTREAVWSLLTKGLAVPVSIVHFAGHGDFSLGVAALSSLKLQDATLTVFEVATQEVRLGRKSGCLVIFNACETGATGSVLAGVGGWAQAILQQRFGGFIAPLWAVDDDDAAIVASDLFDALVNAKRPVAQALLSIRQRYGAKSPTYLAYLFYGDVGAHIGS